MNVTINGANYDIKFDNQLIASIRQINDGGEIIIPFNLIHKTIS